MLSRIDFLRELKTLVGQFRGGTSVSLPGTSSSKIDQVHRKSTDLVALAGLIEDLVREKKEAPHETSRKGIISAFQEKGTAGIVVATRHSHVSVVLDIILLLDLSQRSFGSCTNGYLSVGFRCRYEGSCPGFFVWWGSTYVK